MTVKRRVDSLYKWGEPYYDEVQEEYVWGICDAPPPQPRDDDQFYEIQDGDRFDKLAYNFYGEPRYYWMIMHYNSIGDALAIDAWIGEKIRIPSKNTIEKVYINGS